MNTVRALIERAAQQRTDAGRAAPGRLPAALPAAAGLSAAVAARLRAAARPDRPADAAVSPLFSPSPNARVEDPRGCRGRAAPLHLRTGMGV